MDGLRPNNPRWMTRWLIAAGIYNLVWGLPIILAPDLPFEILGMPPLEDPGRAIWQCLGMVIGVYGIGYLAAAGDPIRHWPIVLVGLLGKVFGPIGFLWTASQGGIEWIFGLNILTNDLIWWVPFGMILLAARRSATGGSPQTG
jgi:small multidrug resistance pump